MVTSKRCGSKAVAVNVLRDGDIAFGGERRKQIKTLKNETDLVAAELGSLGIAHRRKIVAIDQNFAARSLGQAADHVEERRFSATRWAHHRDRFAGLYFKIYPAQRRHLHLARAIQLP